MPSRTAPEKAVSTLGQRTMNDPRFFLFDLPRSGRPAPFRIPEECYPGVRDHWHNATSRRAVDPIEGIRALVIHATAGLSSAGAMSVMKAHRASWHWLIPGTDEEPHGKVAWACAPEASAALHVRDHRSYPAVNGGQAKVDDWSLAIQIVNSRSRDVVEPFSDWQVEIAAEIARYSWAKYPNLKHVVSHALLDPERCSDPGAHFPWQRFRDLVLNGVGDTYAARPTPAAVPMESLPALQNVATCCTDWDLLSVDD
ncbi:N-acetylmuramoyl-L-alanine amidase [Mesorhizobium sp.]|uniref:N-acetylmuramoyl-L-alanine amidase n=1 Tax=Mesorhizobium sp. TaxID=1871066 RepID=UPI0011F64C55|nr:N-acetylmuramoyl-L-alanine amidase [Mesorhizobium sp.]TIQ11951.1 MAG: N-acetylmuramoyl-L-alanine amidase [Mesorhizobium sp.]